MTMGKARKSNLPVLFLILAIFSFLSCREVSVPKPKGYFRIDLPPKKYIVFNETGQVNKSSIEIRISGLWKYF